MPTATPNDTANQFTSYALKIGGKDLDAKFVLLSVRVWKCVQKVSRAEIRIIGGDHFLHTFEESEEATFEPGKDVEISLGFNQTNTLVFKGVILRHGISVKRGYERRFSRSMVLLECADKAIKMTVEPKSEIYEKKKDSDILTTLLSTAGVDKDVTATTVTHAFMAQYQVTDWDFLLKRARANGLLVFNSDNKVEVKAPKVSGSAVAELTFGQDVVSFEGEVDAGTQFQGVDFKSWDPFKESALTQTAAEPASLDKPGNLTGKNLGKVAHAAKWTRRYNPPIETAELKAAADAAMVHSRFKRVRGFVVVRGMGVIKLNTIITLSGFGARFDGDTLVSSVEHTLEDGEFITRVGFGLPKELQDNHPFMEADPLVAPIQGIHIGIVKKLDGDPDAGYRIQVQIPSLKDSGDGLWARLTHFFTGKAAGSFFIPDIGSEVAVGFLENDPRFPIVLGSLYTQKMAPYTKLTKENTKKAILSTEKITIEFDDKDKIMTLKTPGGNKVVISDKGKGITLEDQNGNKVVTSASGIEMKSGKDIKITSGAKVTISGATGVALSASGGDVVAKGLNVTADAQMKFTGKGAAQAELTASGQVTVKGGIVMIN